MGRRRLSLTSRGAIALGLVPVSALAGAFLGAEELVLLSLALATLLLCGLVQSAHRAGRARGNWRIELQLEANEAEVGRPLELGVTLAAAGAGGSVPTWLEDPAADWERVGYGAAAESGLPHPSTGRRVPLLDSGATVTFGSPAPTDRRGVFTLRGPRLWCLDSFGLVAQLIARGPSATISVHPVPLVVEVADEWLRGDPATEQDQPDTPLAPKRRESLGDFSAIRPYVPGDRLRLLHWPALARTGDLMVRDFEDSAPRRVHLVADVRPRLGATAAEAVLAAVAGVGLQVLAQGAAVEMSTTAGERIAVGPGPLGPPGLLRAIAAITLAEEGGARRQPWRLRLPHRHRTSARPETAPHPTDRGLGARGAAPLVVTTRDGADSLPGALGLAHLVLVP
jgi:uncharacterized protein (DUF58 family)